MKLGNRKVLVCFGSASAMFILTAFASEVPNTVTETNQNVTESIICSSDFSYVTDEIEQEIEDNIRAAEEEEKAQDAIAATIEASRAAKVMAEAEEASPWSNRVMANVEESLNVRSTPDETGELVGKLYKGTAADILERGDTWTKISSGAVEGYVKNEFVAFDEEAEAIAHRDGKLTATIEGETIRIRKEPGEDAEVLDLAAEGSTYTAIEDNEQWVAIQYSSDVPGYISGDYVSVELILGEGITIEEEQAAIKAAEEKAAAEAAAKKKEAIAENSKAVDTTTQAAVQASYDDVTLLGALVQMESGGESYEGKLAVASVVVNRLNSGGYPGSISGVIYQSGQFPGAGNGRLAGILSRGVGSQCIEAANAALSGTNNVGGYLHFISAGRANYDSYGSYTVIGNHCFY